MILYFILGLTLLIFLHELGHFAVAKWSGVSVEVFSIGFGPRILGFKKGETDYRLSLIPLGGYVKMLGQDDFANEKDEKTSDPNSFAAKPLSKRMAVVFAGPFMNLMLAFLLLPAAYLVGIKTPKILLQPPVIIGVDAQSPAASLHLKSGDRIASIDGSPVSNWSELLDAIRKKGGKTVMLGVLRQDAQGSFKESFEEVTIGAESSLKLGFLGIEPNLFIDPVIGKLSSGLPAEKSGLATGDRIVSVNQEPVKFWMEVPQKIKAGAGKPIKLEVMRAGRVKTFEVTPQNNNGDWLLGIAPLEPVVEKALLRDQFSISVFQKSVRELTWQCRVIGRVLKNLLTFQKGSASGIGGPIQIAQVSAVVAKEGFGNFLVLLASISLQLGLLNLLPVPVLDGGHLMFMSYEAIRRKPLSFKIRLITQQVGLVLLLGLMVIVTLKDIAHLDFVQHLLQKLFGR